MSLRGGKNTSSKYECSYQETLPNEKIEFFLSLLEVDGVEYIKKSTNEFKGFLKIRTFNPLMRIIVYIPQDTDVTVSKGDHDFNVKC